MTQRFRFRPKFLVIPIAASAMGIAAAVVGLISGMNPLAAIAIGSFGPLLGFLYLRAPAWRYSVVVEDETIAVFLGDTLRFRLPWNEVKEVVCNDELKVLFLDGGAPEKSLLVPGPGAPAPYRIEDAARLYDLILAHVPPERCRRVASLERRG
jgi:hypothetical protein